MNKIALGEQMPNMQVVSTKGTFNLNDLHGKNVILYFYPKDNTPGCTREGQDFRDLHQQFIQNNCVIFGVSRDSMQSHEKFKANQQFPFELIADTDQKLCRLFDVLDEENSTNKDTCSMIRTTFLIDTNGKLIHEWRKVKVDGHAAAVLKFVSELK